MVSILFYSSIENRLDYSSSTSSGLVDPSWNSPSSFTSSIHPTDEENLSDTEYCQQKKQFSSLNNGHTHPSMTNGYIHYNNKSGKSRSCENSLDSCGERVTDDLTTSSSSLIEIPISTSTTSTSSPNNADYDNIPITNVNHEMNNHGTQHSPVVNTKISTQSPSPISSELDKKTKDAIDARLKEIDDELEFDGKIQFTFSLSFTMFEEKTINLICLIEFH